MPARPPVQSHPESADVPKPLGSLSASLLARKGDARPAMRPLALGTATAEPVEDDAASASVTLATARRIARESAARTRNGKAAFTLRLDSDRHVRLRLASAMTRHSSQHLVTLALDAFLQNLPEVDALVAQLPVTRAPK
ncbi:hypothetical protein IFT87_01490 [Sphingomonas sp. CFBP 8765]|nr:MULTISPECIES: hypothetical protein [unclassified Sphingomonas]MBD8468857.1 hypothetical protein [Sphingomonas sp. CFBP 8765]MDY1008446.1 hypothetical protein [Sphingomonas sp. CFBP9019]